MSLDTTSGDEIEEGNGCEEVGGGTMVKRRQYKIGVEG